MRLFLAVFPPVSVQVAAHVSGASLRAQGGPTVSWVKQENLHYTLRFLGELGDDGARRVGEAAREAASDVAPFDAVLGGLGAFPNARRARVLWVGMSEGADPLKALAKALEGALERRGFDRDTQRFSPHLTIGRVREPVHDWTAALAAAQPPAPERFRVDRLTLVESKLSPKGSTYTPVVEAPLGMAAPGRREWPGTR